MSSNFRWLLPASDPIPEVLQAHQLTREFHREIEYREEFDRYCQWYRTTAEQHRRELQTMRRDINLLGWFYRGRNRSAPR